MKKLLLIAVTVSMLLHSAPLVDRQGARKGVWSSDFPAVQEAARQNKTCVFLLFTGSDWCGWCKLMEQNVFSQEAWKSFAAENLYLAYIDFPRDESKTTEAIHNQNVRLQEEFNVEGYPTMFLLDADGNKLETFHVEQDIAPQTFIPKVKRALLLSAEGLENIFKTMPEDKVKAIRLNMEKVKALQEKQTKLEQELAAAQAKYQEGSAAISEELSRLPDPQLQVREYLLEKNAPDAYGNYLALKKKQEEQNAAAEAKLKALLEDPQHDQAEVQKLLDDIAQNARTTQVLLDQLLDKGGK